MEGGSFLFDVCNLYLQPSKINTAKRKRKASAAFVPCTIETKREHASLTICSRRNLIDLFRIHIAYILSRRYRNVGWVRTLLK